MIEANADCDVIGDGFRWRKYGQKVVKGNPYPRLVFVLASLANVIAPSHGCGG